MTEGAASAADGREAPAGTVAEEAARLLAAVQEWAGSTGAGNTDAHGGPDCRYCPVCQLIALLRNFAEPEPAKPTSCPA